MSKEKIIIKSTEIEPNLKRFQEYMTPEKHLEAMEDLLMLLEDPRAYLEFSKINIEMPDGEIRNIVPTGEQMDGLRSFVKHNKSK